MLRRNLVRKNENDFTSTTKMRHAAEADGVAPSGSRRYRNRKRAAIFAAAAAGLLGGSAATRAANFTWDSNVVTAGAQDGAGAWLGANQWQSGGNATWVSGSDAFFGVGGTGGAVTLASATTAQSLTFNSFTGTYTLGTTGSILTINGGITSNAGAGAVSIISPLSLGAQTWSNGSSNSITVGNGGSSTATQINYTGLLTISAGNFTFNVQNSPTGNTTGAGGVKISGGNITNSSTVNPFGTGTLELNSGSIINSTTTTDRIVTNAVSITGNFTFASGGATGTNTFSGLGSTTGNLVLTSNTSQVRFSNAGAFTLGGNLTVIGSGGIVFSGAGGVTGTSNIVIATTGAINSTIGTGNIAITGTITNNGSGVGTTTLSGNLTSTVSAVTQDAANGNLTLSGTNTNYAGTTSLNSGTLILGNNAALGNGGSLVINGGTLNTSAGRDLVANTTYTAGTSASGATVIALSNTSNLVVGQFVFGTGVASGAFITAISPNANITISTPNTAAVTGNGLTFGSLVSQTWASDFTFQGSANLGLGSGAISLGSNAGATRTVTVNANTLTVGGVISGGPTTVNLAKAGAGTLAIVGNNLLNYSGNTTVNLGSLNITGNNSSYTGATTVNAGALRLANPSNTNVLAALNSSNVTLNGGTLQLRANGNTNGGALIVSGTNVIVGSNAVTIDVNNNGSNTQNTISLNDLSLGAGQLNVTGGNSYNLRFGGNTTLTGNATINSTSAGLSLVGVVSGSFGITKLGAATTYVSTQTGPLTLSGNNTYTGVTTVAEGILIVNADAPNGASGALGNATSDVLVGNTSGNVSAYLMSNNFTVGRKITVQSGNNGTAYIGTNSGSGTNTYSGNITLGSDGLAGHSVTFITGSNHIQTFSGIIQDNPTLTGTAGVVTYGDSSTAIFTAATFNGSGTSNGGSIFVVSGNNTYSGGTVIDTSGAVRISNATVFGTGSVSIVRGTIQGDGTSVLSGASGMTWDGDFAINSFSFGTQGAVNLGVVPISLTGNRTLSVSNNTSTIGGVISGSGRSLTLAGGNAAGQALTLNGNSTFDGGLTVSGASAQDLTAQSGNTTAFGTGLVTLTNTSHSKINLNANTTIGSLTSGMTTASFNQVTSALTAGTYALTITGGGGTGASGNATVSATGNVTSITYNSLGTNYTSTPTITLSGSTTTFTPIAFGNSTIALNGKTLTINGTNATPLTYVGIISGNVTSNIIKTGSGTQALTNVNTYQGSTSVTGGTFNIAGAGSINSTSGISINGTGAIFKYDSSVALNKQVTFGASGGTFIYNENSSGYSGGTLTIAGNSTLGGSGKITSAVLTTGSSSAISPGNSPGTLTLAGGLDAHLGTTFKMELGVNPPATESDRILITGGTFTGATGTNSGGLAFEITGARGHGWVLANTTYDLIDYTGSTATDLDLGDLSLAATSYSELVLDTNFFGNGSGFNIDTTNHLIQVRFSAVPEPTSLAVLGLGGLGLLSRRRRRQTARVN